MMYYHDKDDDNKFILMWFIDFGDVVYGGSSEEHYGEKNDVSNACEDHGK